MYQYTIAAPESGQKLDRFIARILANSKKSEIFSLIRKGNIKVNKKKKDPDYRLAEGDTITLFMNDEKIRKLTAERRAIHPKNKTFTVVAEDDNYIIIDKPAGLPCHGGTAVRGHTLIQEVLGYLGLYGEKQASAPHIGFLHRLDKDTCGLMIVAKNYQALVRGNKLFQRKENSEKSSTK